MKKNEFWLSASKDGLIFGLVMFIVLLLGWAFRLEVDHPSSFSLISFMAIGWSIYFFTRRRSQLDLSEDFTFGQSMGYILAVGLFAGFIQGVGQFLMWNYIAVDYYKEMMDLTASLLKESSEVTQEAMTLATSLTKRPFFMVFSGIFNIMVYSCFIGLIVSVMLKRRAQSQDTNQDE